MTTPSPTVIEEAHPDFHAPPEWSDDMQDAFLAWVESELTADALAEQKDARA